MYGQIKYAYLWSEFWVQDFIPSTSALLSLVLCVFVLLTMNLSGCLFVSPHTGDMPNFSEAQNLQNMLKQCHIFFYKFLRQEIDKNLLFKDISWNQKIEKNIFLPNELLSQEIGTNHTIVLPSYIWIKYSIWDDFLIKETSKSRNMDIFLDVTNVLKKN